MLERLNGRILIQFLLNIKFVIWLARDKITSYMVSKGAVSRPVQSRYGYVYLGVSGLWVSGFEDSGFGA